MLLQLEYITVKCSLKTLNGIVCDFQSKLAKICLCVILYVNIFHWSLTSKNDAVID